MLWTRTSETLPEHGQIVSLPPAHPEFSQPMQTWPQPLATFLAEAESEMNVINYNI